MTDNEIIKALEQCKSGCNKKCILFHTDECQYYLMENIFDLIKRQQEHIEELEIQTGLMRRRKYYDKFVKEVFQKEKGNDLVHPDFDEIYKRYFEQQAEIERYKDLEEQGRLIELPCKDGATVYWITTHGILERYTAITEPIHSKIVELRPLGLDGEVYPYNIPTFFNAFGESVFLTKAEAEAKLKELVGGKNV